MKELKTFTTGKGTYDSFPDKTARAELPKKLSRPATAQVGDYLRIKSIGEDGSMEVEAVPAPESGGGAAGDDGITPHIGENGNWWIGDTDTGVSAEGEDGGHYTPVVTQPTDDTMKVSFTPSKAGMPAVDPVTVKLPSGSDSGQDVDLSGYAQKSELPTKVSQLENDSGYLTDHQDLSEYAKKTEIPAVPVQSVNGKTGAVALNADDVGARPATWMPSASDVGALPDSTVIPSVPTKISAFTNDVGYLTQHQDISGKLDASELTTAVNTALAQAKARGEFDGQDGEDGSDGVSTTHSWNGTTLTVTSASGTSSADLKGDKGDQGEPGADGAKGDKGDKGDAFTYSDFTAEQLASLKGEKGDKGDKGDTGAQGIQGIQGEPGEKGETGEKGDKGDKGDTGATGAAGKDGSDGQPGTPGADGADGYTPIKGVDYYTDEDKSEFSEYIATELAKRGQLIPEFANSIEECTDTTKLYILPDGYIYAYMLTEVESGPAYTNVLPTAINSDGTEYVGANGEDGYKVGWRINSSVAEKESAANCMTGYIPVKANDVIRIKNVTISAASNGYFHWFNSNFEVTTPAYYENNSGNSTQPDASGLICFNAPNVSGLAYFRMTTGVISDETIITLNEEITEGGGTTTDYAWANTGIAFVSTDYGPKIADLEAQVAENTTDIANLKQGNTSATAIKDWDAPIYDVNIPVFQLSAEKAAMTNATTTPDSIYAMYDALMAKHPKYITKTDLGLCSDGVNHVYRYDFREPDPHYESNKEWSETKIKAILMTGVHYEWAGIYSLYYALEEIADNPELRNFRRNTHLIVVPVANPYATIAANYQDGLDTPNSYGVRNANGVEIHRNFEVDWVLTDEGTTHYGGAEPLSEVETQNIDSIMANNTDAALFLSAHNCGVDTFWGTGFIWSSTATKYMCNLGFRLVNKLSDAWMDKYGDILSAGIEEYKTELLEDGDTRLGWAGLSTSPGTEAKQATKYGIQGTNIETCNPFQIHGTTANPEPSMSEFTMSRGAEVYVNFLLTAFGVYDPKDKKEYAPNAE